MDAKQAWEAVLGQLQIEMPKATFDTWVRPAEFVAYEDGSFRIGVQNAFARDWLDSRLTSTVTRLLTGIMNRTVEVLFVLWQECLDPRETLPEMVPEEELIQHTPDNSTLNPKYTIKNFFSDDTYLPFAAAKAVIRHPGKRYTPLFIYGDVGLGKTHLLHAIGNALGGLGLKVLCVSAEDITNDLKEAIRTHQTHALRDKYRTVDVLLIDEIDFISGKEATQEELHHIMNDLDSKQIVIVSKQRPEHIIDLKRALCSRFQEGLVVEMLAPHPEVCVEIMRRVLEDRSCSANEVVLETIAKLFSSDLREMLGHLNHVTMEIDINGLPQTEEAVINLLSSRVRRQEVTLEGILASVAQEFDVSEDDLLGRDRRPVISLPRQVVMYLAVKHRFSTPKIGRFLGNRDHTTVGSGRGKITDLLESDDKLANHVQNIERDLEQLVPVPG